MIDRLAEQIVSVITHLCQKSKLSIDPNLRRPSFSFTYSFKFTYYCIVDIWTLKKEFCLKNKKRFTAIKTTTKHKELSQIYIAGRL